MTNVEKKQTSKSGKFYLLWIGCSMFFVTTLNMIIVLQHISFASVSMSNKNDDYTMSLTWKNANGNGNDNGSSIDTTKKGEEIPSGMATPSGGSNMRTPDRQDDPEKEEQNSDKKVKIKKTVIKRFNPPDAYLRFGNAHVAPFKNGLKPGNKNKNEDKDEEKTKDKDKDKDEDEAKDKDEDKVQDKDEDEDKETIIDKDKDKEENADTNVNASNFSNSTAFVRHDHVVIATKIHGVHQWPLLVQSMCLLHYAYNHKVLYDIVAFSTEPVPEEDIQSLQAMLSPAKFRLVVDNRGLHEEIAALTPTKLDAFLKMCNVSEATNLTWFSNCDNNRLAYNWQAEFRSIHLWQHPSMADYKTMVWLDTDGFATKVWEKDPVDYFIENDGVIMFDHFPQATSKYWIQKRLYAAFNATICKLKLSKETGNLVTELGTGDRCQERGVPNIHGFFHITNMDFYRSPIVRDGLDTIHDDCFLCRFPDDQLAVTAPAAILAPERSWEMRSKGFHLDVFHNFLLDGIDQAKPAGFMKYWDQIGQHTHPTAAAVCKVTEAG